MRRTSGAPAKGPAVPLEPSARRLSEEKTRAEFRLAEISQAYSASVSEAWRGRERTFVLELVRALDEVAFAFTLAPNRARLIERDARRDRIRLGAASALRPFLQVLAGDPGGVPWGPTTCALSSLADQHLENCGRIAGLARVAALERYGLAQSTFVRQDHLVIEVASACEDAASLKAEQWLQGLVRRRSAQGHPVSSGLSQLMRDRIDEYLDVDDWFIKYDSDAELIAYYRRLASLQASGCAEAGALPGEVTLGGRSFQDWNAASVAALGRVLHHLGFATRLLATQPELELRNLLTAFARRSDVFAVLKQAGEDPGKIAEIMSCMTLDAPNAEACERSHEIPLPYYVDYGRDFVLLPVFGGLLNPCAGLVWELKRRYRRDWDRGVASREAAFRQELRSLFPPPRFEVPDSGRLLRRPDGGTLTDIDALVLDLKTGSLGLFQLKWHDVFGRSLAERNSRRLNLLAANEWVARVNDWVKGRSSCDVGAALGLRSAVAGKRPPCLFVLARHAARFAGDHEFDQRATWAGWAQVVWAFERSQDDVDVLWSVRKRLGRKRSSHANPASGVSIHPLPGLTVEIRG